MFLVALCFIWVLQGTGLLDWPADSFMLRRGEWAKRGAGTALAGAALIGLAVWRARR